MSRCLCDQVLPTNCVCGFEDSTSTEFTGAGPFELGATVNPASTNLISCGADGLLGRFPPRLLVPPRATATRVTDQAMDPVGEVVSFTTKVGDDPHGFFVGAGPWTVATIPYTGLYDITFTGALLLENTTKDLDARITSNVATLAILTRKLIRNESGTLPCSIAIGTEMNLSAGATVGVFIDHDETVDRDLIAGPRYSPFFSIALVGNA